jgi:hypothetical protein
MFENSRAESGGLLRDDKLYTIMKDKNHGSLGFAAYIYILDAINANAPAYYKEYGNIRRLAQEIFDFVGHKNCAGGVERVLQVILDLCEVGLLDATLAGYDTKKQQFSSDVKKSVLTSTGVQKRYLRACATERRVPYIKDYWLLSDEATRLIIAQKCTTKANSCTEMPNSCTEMRQDINNKKQEIKNKEGYINRARDGEAFTALDYEEFISIVGVESSIILRRHQAAIDSGNLNVVESVRQSLDALCKTSEEYEELFRHAEKTYISQPKFTKCDVVWVLNNHKKVMATELYDAGSENVKKQKKESDGESWGDAVKRQLERYKNE